MTYNIKTGGVDGDDPARLDRALRVIEGQRPDVLALQELRGFRRGDRLAALAGELGMRAFPAWSCWGQPVAVLVRRPGRIRSAGPVRRPFHHAAERVVVATDRGPLTVIGTHLYPYSGGRRLWEARWLAAAMARAGDGLGLLLGDLNSLDPGTEHAARLARLPTTYRRRHLRTDGVTVDTRAVERLYRAGLVDLFRLARPVGGREETAPTTYGGGAEFSGMRLDYLLGTPAVGRLVRRCAVVDGGEAEWASDHYPVVADLDLCVEATP